MNAACKYGEILERDLVSFIKTYIQMGTDCIRIMIQSMCLSTSTDPSSFTELIGGKPHQRHPIENYV